MVHVKLLADLINVARHNADRFYVTNGDKAVGPVNLDLLARGLSAGKVPITSFVRHEGWKVWRPLAELAVVIDDEDITQQESPSFISEEELERISLVPTDDVASAGRPSTPDDFHPADATDGASDRDEALSLLLSAAAIRVSADAAIAHRVDDQGTIVIGAHGQLTNVIGCSIPVDDPALAAARTGAVVVAEPMPGPAGRAVRTRLVALDGNVDAAVMFPVRVHEGLIGMIEIGRSEPFRHGEMAAIEALIDALVKKLEG